MFSSPPNLAGPVYLIVEYAMHGNLKDYLHQCKEAVERLNRRPLIARGSRRRQPSSLSSGYHAFVLQEKIPLSQQSSVFSDVSHTSRIDCPSPDCLGSTESGVRRLTQDSGLGAEGKGSISSEGVAVVGASDAASVTNPSEEANDYINCKGLLYMEDVSNFALQIACGLQHLDHLKVCTIVLTLYRMEREKDK
jgi:hypothetical protein